MRRGPLYVTNVGKCLKANRDTLVASPASSLDTRHDATEEHGSVAPAARTVVKRVRDSC